jgi:[acyl-carrier-protein] S-malonyltransferase
VNSRLGFIFPGQGSQVTGMGKDICENYPIAKEIFDIADDLFGQSIKNICFSGSAEFLQRTEIAQPALLTVSVALSKVLISKGINPAFLAGHSLGEYSALVCSEVLSFESAFNLVKIRGHLMAKAGEKVPGTMVAVIGANKKELEKDCMDFSVDDSVVIANYNSPDQIVISGTLDGIEEFSILLRNKGYKVLPLNVSGAFHCHLMQPALEELVEAIEETEFKDAKIPVITNVDGSITWERKKFKEKLKWQLVSPVLWEDCVNSMITQGVEAFVEVGPQKVLSKLVRRIDKNQVAYTVEDTNSLNSFLEIIKA